MANMLLLNPFQMTYQEVNTHVVNLIQDVNLDAPASSAEGGKSQGGAFGPMGGFLWIIILLAFMMIIMRPRQDKEGEKFRNALQKEQDVVTSTGIFGKVKDIDEVSVTLEIAQGMKIKVDKRYVQGSPKSRFAEFFKKIGDALLKLFRGDFSVFLLFLGLTLFFWWSQTMNQNYETQMKLPVIVADIPENVRITSQPARQLTVSLSGKGSTLRKSGRRGSRNVLRVRNSAFVMGHGHASLSTSRLRDSIAAMLPPSVAIHSISPDSLVYQYSVQHSVMLPVQFDGTTESQDQFFLERIEFTPDSIRALILDSDTAVHQAVAEVGQLLLSSDTIIRTVPLKRERDVIFSQDEVTVTVLSQQYTEKSLEIPITGVNFPEYVHLKAFPARAVVTFWVKMSEYDRVTASDFQVVVDYNDVSADASKARLRIYSQPANVRNVRLQTRTVDYLMEHTY